MINLHKLDVFLHVVEEGSFSGAAERLLMTQSGVSQHIQDLEHSLGTRLFLRGRRGVRLTRNGQILHKYARRIFALVAEAENAVTDVSQLAGGMVSVGATPGVSVYVLTEWIQSFQTRYPKLSVHLETKITPEIVASLLAGRLDIGIIEGELDEEIGKKLQIFLLESIDQCVVVGQKHPLWPRQNVDLQELDGQRFIMRQPVSQSRIWLDDVLRRHGVTPQIGAEFDNVESIKRAVMAGSALTILPEYAVHSELAYGVLRAIPLEGEPLQRTLKLIWEKQRYLSPIARSLLHHLEDAFPVLTEFNQQFAQPVP